MFEKEFRKEEMRFWRERRHFNYCAVLGDKRGARAAFRDRVHLCDENFIVLVYFNVSSG